MSTADYGLVSWDHKSKNPNIDNNQNNNFSFEFAKLKDGPNRMRIITGGYKYYAVRYKAKGQKFGQRIKSAYPNNRCPMQDAGFNVTDRYRIGVIQRSEDPDEPDQVRILDTNSIVWDQLTNFAEDIEYGPPTEYDIVVKRNPNASAANYYSVMPRPKKPLSEEDAALKIKHEEELKKTLQALTTPSTPEQVRKRMDALGEADPPKKKSEAKETNGQSDYSEPDDDDYQFAPQN